MGAQISQFGPSTEGHLEGEVAAHTRLLCPPGSRQSILADGWWPPRRTVRPWDFVVILKVTGIVP